MGTTQNARIRYDSSTEGAPSTSARFLEEKNKNTLRYQLQRGQIEQLAQREVVANQDIYAEEEALEEEDRAQAYLENTQKAVALNAASSKAKKTSKKVLQSLSRRTMILQLSIAGVLYTVQFIVSIVSLFIMFGAELTGFSPDDDMAVWGASAAIGFISYLIFFAWFHITGNDPLEGETTGLVNALVFTASVLPFLSFIPAIPLWIVYMNARSLLHN